MAWSEMNRRVLPLCRRHSGWINFMDIVRLTQSSRSRYLLLVAVDEEAMWSRATLVTRQGNERWRVGVDGEQIRKQNRNGQLYQVLCRLCT
jgi:hypothetical protein